MESRTTGQKILSAYFSWVASLATIGFIPLGQMWISSVQLNNESEYAQSAALLVIVAFIGVFGSATGAFTATGLMLKDTSKKTIMQSIWVSSRNIAMVSLCTVTLCMLFLENVKASTLSWLAFNGGALLTVLLCGFTAYIIYKANGGLKKGNDRLHRANGTSLGG